MWRRCTSLPFGFFTLPSPFLFPAHVSPDDTPPPPLPSFPSHPFPFPQNTLNARVVELTAEVEAATAASSLLQASLAKEKEEAALLRASLDKEKEEAARRAQLLEERAEAAEEATLAARREVDDQREAAGEAGMAAAEAAEPLRREKVGWAVLCSRRNVDAML